MQFSTKAFLGNIMTRYQRKQPEIEAAIDFCTSFAPDQLIYYVGVLKDAVTCYNVKSGKEFYHVEAIKSDLSLDKDATKAILSGE